MPYPDAHGDRDVQDDVIRYLSDAKFRSIEPDFLSTEDQERARRFARFLARRYYRDRLQRGFRHSQLLLQAAEHACQLVDLQEFNAILDKCELGSLSTSEAVADLAVQRLAPLRNDAWWNDLLEYERAFFLQLATSEYVITETFPKWGCSTVLRRFQFDMPELLARIEAANSTTDCAPSEMWLLFSRTTHGKIFVVELDFPSVSVMRAVDGLATAESIADSLSLSFGDVDRILTTLADLGAVSLPTLSRLAVQR